MWIELKDKGRIEVEEGLPIFDILLKVDEELAKRAAVARMNGELADLRTVPSADCELEILTTDTKEGVRVLRHSASHVLAQAVKELYPDAKLAIGPAIDEGFYYDFDMESLGQEALDKIEALAKKIIKKGSRLKSFTLPRAEAIALMNERKEPYKVELINDLPEDAVISFYEQDGGFVDLCAGPHLMNLRGIKAFKLLSSSSAYWRGDSNRQSLTRIYGTAFDNKEDLEAHLAMLEDRKNRDHNKLGRELELFTTVDVIGQGLPLLMPRGTAIIQTLQRWIEDEEERRGYMRTKTPMMAKSDLYKISDHWYHYKDGMFLIGEDDEDEEGNSASGKEIFALRPMTCPFQYYVYKNSQKSYRDLPCRYGETSTLFRNEDSGEMHGLTRVRQFTISEGHLIVAPDQLTEEFKGCVDLAKYCLTTLGLADDVTYRMSKWDPDNAEKYLGTAELWDKVESSMRSILDEIGITYTEAVGEAAFYGPKLDIQAKNVYGKEDTMITIQLDMFLAERFDMSFIDRDGEKKRPYIIHRTSMGCYERTLAWLIEKYAGAFPTWLCPEQVRILPISEKYTDYADEVLGKLKAAGIKATVDSRSEKIGYKIRQARLMKLPYMLIVGEQEQEQGLVAVRSRFKGDEGQISISDFVADISKEIENKEIRRIEAQE